MTHTSIYRVTQVDINRCKGDAERLGIEPYTRPGWYWEVSNEEGGIAFDGPWGPYKTVAHAEAAAAMR